MDPYLPFRRIGRSTRMIRAAIRLASDGQHVLVWAPDERTVGHLREILVQEHNDPLRLAVVSPWSTKLSVGKGSVEIRSFAHDRASNNVLGDYGTFMLAGASHRTQYFLDHSLLERLYPNVLQQWLEFIR